jgi:hypothetical protein
MAQAVDREGHVDGLAQSPWNDQSLALKCLERALKESAAALRSAGLGEGLTPKQQFKASLAQVLSRRDNPVIQTTLCLPVRGVRQVDGSAASDTKSLQLAERMVHCVQTPARHLSDNLQAAYDRDELQGIVCHDDAQHQHATTLYRSELRDAKDGHSLLTLTRHGAISAFGLTRRGIETLSDERLGRIAMDLTPVEKTALWGRKQTDATDGLGSDQAQAREVGAYVRRLASTEAGVRLLDGMRSAASQRRAKEVAQAALCGLPAEEIVRIRAASSAGNVPIVRLASVALLTPDALRHDSVVAKYSSDERQMWLDQRDAWQALEGELQLQVPLLDSGGQIGRDESGQIQTSPLKVKLEVAAFDLPVNKGGVSSLSLASGRTLTEPSNRQALEKLLGHLPAQDGLTGYVPAVKSWVGQALQALSQESPKRQQILELSRQVASLVSQGRHLSRADDPYILVRRLLVLADLTGIVAPAVNCRSGKDRTTEAEAQARQLAFEIASTGRVPALDGAAVERHDDAGRQLREQQLWSLHNGGGAREIQAWSTTVAGTKLDMPALTAQYGIGDDPALKREYIGLSKSTAT